MFLDVRDYSRLVIRKVSGSYQEVIIISSTKVSPSQYDHVTALIAFILSSNKFISCDYPEHFQRTEALGTLISN